MDFQKALDSKCAPVVINRRGSKWSAFQTSSSHYRDFLAFGRPDEAAPQPVCCPYEGWALCKSRGRENTCAR